jgi:hypothetical protein
MQFSTRVGKQNDKLLLKSFIGDCNHALLKTGSTEEHTVITDFDSSSSPNLHKALKRDALWR